MNEIEDRIGENFYSLHDYGDAMVNGILTKHHVFTKYAAVQVNPTAKVPEDMELIELAPQTYAVFRHYDYTRELRYAYNRVYQVWLPENKEKLSTGFHIEIMKPSYFTHPNAKAEEVIYVPIRSVENC